MREQVKKAIEWVKGYHEPVGRVIPHRNRNVVCMTQETAGYMISTLCDYGERDLAIKLSKWEAAQQSDDGSFVNSNNIPYTFDTAQVIRGFLSVLDDMPEIEPYLRKACDYIVSKIADDGEVLHESYDSWKFKDGSMFSKYGNLYVLPPLLEAGIKLSEQKYIDSARFSMDYYRQKPDLVDFKPNISTFSHYFGYMMEALADLDEIDLVKKGMAQAERLQKKDGSVPAYPGVNWVCSTGIAQLAIVWYKLGQRDRADRAMEYLEKIQNHSGGFYGSYGWGARYFPQREIDWAVKFFLDASYLNAKGA